MSFCIPGKPVETLIHEFGNHVEVLDESDWHWDDEYDDVIDPELAFLEDAPVASSQTRTTFDRFAAQFADLGVPLPDELLQSVRELPFQEAITRFRDWHNERMLHFLQSAE